MSMKRKFIPVKITDKKWADRFVQGEVFMRALADFGVWNRLQNVDNAKINNNFRGDLREATVRHVEENFEQEQFLQGMDPEFLNVIKDVDYIDYSDMQYFKVFCLYNLYYNEKSGTFEDPDEQLASFGDTAVIITDMEAFTRRLLLALCDREDKENTRFFPAASIVEYYASKTTNIATPLFHKNDAYSWQNELRIALGELDIHNKFLMSPNQRYPLIPSTDPILLNIGSIEDITLQIPVQDFISLDLPTELPKRCVEITPASLLGKIIDETQQQFKNYVPMQTKLIFTI